MPEAAGSTAGRKRPDARAAPSTDVIVAGSFDEATEITRVASASPYAGHIALADRPTEANLVANSSNVPGSTGSEPTRSPRSPDRSTSASSRSRIRRVHRSRAKLGAVEIVTPNWSIKRNQPTGRRRKAAGGISTLVPPA